MKTRSLLTLVAAAALLTSCESIAMVRTAQNLCSMVIPALRPQTTVPAPPPSPELQEARKTTLNKIQTDLK
jgi:hypothetical protein